MSTTSHEPNMVLVNEEFDVVGTRPIRHDGVDKVTGRALYGADHDTVGMLHGSILRSPHAHARIVSIDTSKAEALTGVFAVVTGQDLPETNAGTMVDTGGGNVDLKYLRENILARDKALYRGHAVAAVAASSLHIANEAAALIEVEYEVLEYVGSALDGMKKDAPLLHDDLKTNELGEKTDEPSNVATHFQFSKGDLEKGFEEADVAVEREFENVTVHQGYLEPQVATALWNEDGRLHIWCSTQGSFVVRGACSKILDLPVSQIRVVPMEIGGGFGGKLDVYQEPVAALLSKKTGRAVKIVMTRADVFEGTGPAPASHIKVKIGAKKDGTITAAQAYLAYEAGAFPGSPVGAAGMTVFAAYDVENIVVDGYDVVVNKPKSAAYRAPGAPNAAFAAEQVIDEIARALEIDPIDFRLQNAAKEGTRRVDGPAYPRIGCVEVLEAMKNHPHYKSPIEGPNRGRGVGIGFWFNIGFPSSCTIMVNDDGTVNLVEGSTDIGGTRASIAMQAAEVLGIAAEDVCPTVVDTDSIGYTSFTAGSRTTFATGWAAYEAANDIKRQMIERAAKIWEVDADAVEFENGVFKSENGSTLSMNFKELAGKLGATGGPIVGRAAVNPRHAGGSFAGNIVDVEVDPETGKVEILRFTVVQDAGKAIHPSYVEGQMQGGSVQGIGWALNEEYYMDDQGRMANTSLLDYRMPTSLDVPMIDTVIVEVANPGHPYGVRGVGEANIIPTTPTIANAIHDATGLRMQRLPMNPGAIMEAAWNQRK